MKSYLYILFLFGLSWSSADEAVLAADREDPYVVRDVDFEEGGYWYGEAVCYGPYRDGQDPDGAHPTREQIREDLQLITGHWRTIRLYGSMGSSRDVLELLRDEFPRLRVMLGVWLAQEATRDEDGTERSFPEAAAANRAEVEMAITLADEFEDQVSSICVGNETQVYWSAHRMPPDILIGYLREVRSRTRQPVTTADDYNFWNRPQSRDVAREVDFICVYAHPLWNGVQLNEALDWTVRTVDDIVRRHPDRKIVLGETGWATCSHDEGMQAKLIEGTPDEAGQAVFYEKVRSWSRERRLPVFFFEAFDENWKGGDHPDEVEKHWGVYNADRTPKAAVADER